MKLIYFIKNTLTLTASYLVFTGINTTYSLTWIKLASLWDVVGATIAGVLLLIAAVAIGLLDSDKQLEFAEKASKEFSWFWSIFSPLTQLIGLGVLIYIGATWFAFGQLISLVINLSIISWTYKWKKAYNKLVQEALAKAARTQAMLDKLHGYRKGATVDV